MMMLSNRASKRISSLAILSFFVVSLFSPRGGFCNVLPGKAEGASHLVALSAPQAAPTLVGLKLHPDNPQKIDFIFDTANNGKLDQAQAKRMINYFLAGLTIPTKDLWVNLSPYEQSRIVPQALGVTDLGKDMLAQDYFLKQLSASLTYPETELGKKYWESVNGVGANNHSPVNTFSKIWITPGKAEVYEGNNTVLITKSSLKAMLESDYLALSQNSKGKSQNNGSTNNAATTAMREKILPQIENDINGGSNFATLRQAYNSMILAVWFKEKFEQSFFKYYLNQAKIKGIDLADKNVKEKIWAQYVAAFKAGAYDYIKSERVGANNYSPASKITRRHYFSGGATAAPYANPGAIVATSDPAVAAQALGGHELVVSESRVSGFDLDAHPVSGTSSDSTVSRGDNRPTPFGLDLLDQANIPPNSGKSALPVHGIEFKPSKINYDLRAGKEPIAAGYFKQFATRTPEQARVLLAKAKAENVELSISGYARGVDGGGTSLDLPLWQDILTLLGVTSLADLPATSTTTTNFPIKLRFEPLGPGHEDEVVYVAPSYGITEDKPIVVKGDVVLKDGKTNQAHAPAYIFANLFGLRGVKIICEEINPMVIAGGLESSNVVNMALIAAASMLSGANLSYADIFAAAVRIENNDLGGLTGGQGHGSVVLGGANMLIWTSGIKNAEGQLVNPYSFVAVPLLDEAGIKAFENHVMLVQAGKTFVDGNAVVPRTAEMVNNMWTFVLAEATKDPALMPLFTEQVELLKKWRKAMHDSDYEALGQVVARIVELRDQVERTFVGLALDHKNGKEGLPAYAKTFHDLIFDHNFAIDGKTYYDSFKAFRDSYFDANKGEAWLRAHTMYDLEPIAPLAEAAKKEGIYMMALGAGGPGANLVAISAKGIEHIKAFLQAHGMGEIDAEAAKHMIVNDPEYSARQYVEQAKRMKALHKDGIFAEQDWVNMLTQAIEHGRGEISKSDSNHVSIKLIATRVYDTKDKNRPLAQQDLSVVVAQEVNGRVVGAGWRLDAGLTMRGYMPLKIGREGMKANGFQEMKMALPAGGQQVNVATVVKHAGSPVANVPVRGNIVVQNDKVKIGIDNAAGFSPRDVMVELNGKVYNLLTEEPGVSDPAFTMFPTNNRLDLEGEWIAPDGTHYPYKLTMEQAKEIQAKGYMLVLPGEPGPIHGLRAWKNWQVTHNPDGSVTGVAGTDIEGVPELFQGLEVAETHAAKGNKWVILDRVTNKGNTVKPFGTGIHFWWGQNPNGETAEAAKVADRAKVKVQFSADFAYATDPNKKGRWPTGEIIPIGSAAAKEKRFGFDKGQVIGDITPETIFDDVFHLQALPEGIDYQYVTIYDPITNTTKIIKASRQYNHVVVFTPFWPGANGALCVEVQTDATNKFYLQKLARERGDQRLADAVKGLVLEPGAEENLEMESWIEEGEVTVEKLQARERAAKAEGSAEGTSTVEGTVATSAGDTGVAPVTPAGTPEGGVSWNKLKVSLNAKSGQFYFKRGFLTGREQGLVVDLNGQRSQKTIKQIIQEDGLVN